MTRTEMEKLEAMLREQGRDETPAFSLPLHQRVLEALRVQGLPQPAARPVASRSWGSMVLKIGVPLAAAAAVAVVSWIVLHPAPSASKPVIVDRRVPLELPQVNAPNLAQTKVLDDAKFAYLDRDARKLWMFVASQIPELPEEKKDR